MILKSLILKNFRAYKNIKISFDSNLNVIIGQNDIGKSTILEALDIFFGQEIIKLDITDWNKEKSESYITIGAEFEIAENFEIIIDSENRTNLKNEYLLNENSLLEIHKVFDISNDKLQKEKIYINANYFDKSGTPIINQKITDLRKYIPELSLIGVNQSKSSELRQAIYSKYLELGNPLKMQLIEIAKEDTKTIWDQLLKELPVYFLFQSDRANKDSDGDIQNPLKSATKKIVADFEEEFQKIKVGLEEKLIQIGNETILKMKDMGLEVANSLIPKVSNKSLDSLFSFNLESDDGIALNKRGSGFRRMVMLNYFRAEAERKIIEKNNKNVIYAIEEPETAQHPNHQKMLIEALIELSSKENHQIILTTHTPEIAKMVNEYNLIIITKDESGNPVLIENQEDKLNAIIQTLGILPSLHLEKIQKVKVVICVEGYSDIEFLKNINQNIEEFKNIVDLNSEAILLVFLGGSALEHWVNNRYLSKLQIPEIHIYDSDINQAEAQNKNKYQKFVRTINRRQNSDCAYETTKAELENYIHPEIIKNHYDFETIYHLGDVNWLEKWSTELNIEKYVKEKKGNQKSTKKGDFSNLAKQLTKSHLEELQAFEEIKNWFEKIEELSQ